MIKRFLFTALLLITCAVCASADYFEVDGLYYIVNDDNTTVTVSGSSSYYGPKGHLTIPESVTFDGISFPVTSICNNAFEWCSDMTSVTIPNSVTSIGRRAFARCRALGSVTIPNSVTEIGEQAFIDCSSDEYTYNGLCSVTIGNSVTYIGPCAFCNCNALERIEAYPDPEKVTMGYNVFYNVPKYGTLHVRPKYLSAYQTADEWRAFKNIQADLTDVGKGDINDDGSVDGNDVSILLDMVLSGGVSADQLEAADINNDQSVDGNDVSILLEKALSGD